MPEDHRESAVAQKKYRIKPGIDRNADE